MNPLPSAIVVEPQKFLDPPPLGLDRAASQTAHLAGSYIMIEELHALPSVAQELAGQFARPNLAHPPVQTRLDMPPLSGILKAFRSQKQSSADKRM
jgi:hypothetical protein